MARVGILGSGVVGTALGKGLEKLGNHVTFYDPDERRVRELHDSGLRSTSDIASVVYGSDISFVCVPTPTLKGKIDLSYVKSVIENLARFLKTKDDYHVVVIKSTVVPMTTERIVIPLLEKKSKKKVGEEIGVCVNPEFMTEVHRSWTEDPSFARDFFSEERIVIGEFDKRSGDVVEDLYKPLNIPIFRTDLKTAEMIKYASNCCLLSRISYWNEIFLICNKMGIDAQRVADIVALDKRIGRYGSVLGKAAGGKCLEKDTIAFVNSVKGIHKPKLLRAVLGINRFMAKKYGKRE